jgi:7-keto-8-aminopelargonate synthetase-like enzyme
VRYRYANADMSDLERCLKEPGSEVQIICTDGVFSMDGNVAPMDKICDLADKYDALVMVDESHSAGVVGKTGHGVASSSTAMAGSMCSPARLERRLAARSADSPQAARK